MATNETNEKKDVMPEELANKLLSDMEEKAAEIIREAEMKAKEILEAADKRPSAGQQNKAAGPTAAEEKAAHKKVPVELFKDNNLYRDDVYVAVNGQNIKIKRGQKVEIDQMFAEVLDNSKRQDAAAADLNEQLENDYQSKSDALE